VATSVTTSAGEILAAVYAALNVTSLVTTLGCPVYDDVPQGSAFPYVVIGSSSGIPWDTFGKAGKQRVVTIHVYSAYQGGLQARAIFAEIMALLNNQSLSVSGHSSVNVNYEQDVDASVEEVEGTKIVHKVLLFRVYVQED